MGLDSDNTRFLEKTLEELGDKKQLSSRELLKIINCPHVDEFLLNMEKIKFGFRKLWVSIQKNTAEEGKKWQSDKWVTML